MSRVQAGRMRRVAIVTGGGRGLGRIMARALADTGMNVVITASRSDRELVQTSADIEQATSCRCLPLSADAANWSECERVVASTLSAFGRIDMVVNNAARGSSELVRGQYDHHAVAPAPLRGALRMLEVEVDSLHTMVGVNLLGPLHMAKAALPTMLSEGFGRIVNISTSRLTMIRTNMGPYGPIKRHWR